MFRRGRRLAVAIAALIALLFGGRWAAVVLTDRWWAQQLSPAAVGFLTDWHVLRLVLDLSGVLLASAWFIGHLLLVYRAVGSVQVRRNVANLEFREAILPGLALLLLIRPPIIQVETHTIFREMRARWRPADELVVSRGMWARIQAEYYGRRVGIERWTHLDRLRGQYTAEEILRGYLKEIDAYRGSSRTWFYLDGLVDCERETMLGYLGAIGTELYSIDSRFMNRDVVSAHLYDLSDPERLGAANAATWPVPECRE